MRAEDSTVLGPHLVIFTDLDSNYPLYQQRNWTHNDITQSYDSYWDSNNWISSDSNANFRTMKYDGRLLFTSACNMSPGSIVDNDWRTAFAINSNSFLGIGTSNFYNRVTMRAEDSTVLGPHLVIFTDLDSNYPLYQQRNWTHNDITQSYDSYWDSNNWISSDSNANFRTMKKNGRFLFTSACNMTPGSIVDNDWRTAFAINSNSFLGIGTSNFYNRVTMRAEDSTVLGPHLVIFTDADPNYPLYQQRNWTHNDITQSYDSYWDSNNWISSHHTGNFKISKLNGQFTFQSACNMIAGSILDNVWRNAFTINSNSFIGIGTSNIYNRVTMRAEDSTVLGPHLAIFTDVDSNYPLYQMRNWTHNDITQSYDSYWDSNNWISSDSNANFRTMKYDGRLLFTSACNMIPGTVVDDDWRTAFAINSNSFLGIGTSNFYNRVTMRAEDSTVLGPHLVMFTDLDSNHPLYQQRNWTHNDITQSYDSYWDSNNWISSDSNANFRTMKYEGRLLFTSACNMTPGSIVDNDWRTAFAINSNSFLGIGTSNFYNRVTMRAEDSTVLGPHLAIFTDVDSNHPLYQQRNWTHNDITQSYDSYWNSNNWISSDSNANFRIMKKDGKLLLTSACNMTPGSIVDNNWRTAFMVNSNSFLGIGNSNPTHRVTMRAEDSTVLGPHMAFYTDIDQSNPLLQIRNWTHDDVAISFDSYWNSNNWASSSTSGNFQIYKQHGRLIFYSACNSDPTSNIDSSLFPALVINSSNSLIGIGMSNPTHRLTITGESNNVLGPHLAYYLTSDSNYPVFQQYNADHDNIAMSFDSFWNGSNWISSSTTGNFQIVKHNGRLLFQNATYQTVGDTLDNSWFTALTINSNNYIGIRNSNPTHPLDVHGNVIFRSNVTYSAHAIPNSNAIYDLGTSNLRWRDLYLSGASVDMDSLALKKDYTTGGLIVFDKIANAVTRICVKELLVGDPTNLLNSNVFLMTASSNGLHFDNVTSNVPPQAYSQLNNLYVNATSIGLGNSNPEKTAQFFGDFEINPNIPRIVQWTNCIIQNDIDDLQGLASGTKIDYWGRLSNNQIGNPIYNKRGGYYDGPYIQCTYGSNYFTTSNTNLQIATNAGFTALAMVRFNREITSNATIFEFSNSTEYIGLTRNVTTNQLRFATDEIISTPLLSPNNIIYQNEWALYTVRYDALSNMVSLFKNINVTYSNDNSFVWNPFASNDSITISDKNFSSSNVSIGNANIDISYFYIFDRFVFNEELLDIARSILYNANASLKIKTDVQPYPPLEFYSDSLGWLPNGTRNGGQLYSKSYKHMMYGNGTYNIWANNENSPTDISHLAFNIQTDNNWSTSLTTFVSTVDSITPAILYIEIPNLIYVQAYTITASYLDATQSPSKWILYGSLDNSTWFDIDTIANENTWTVSETRVFYTNSWSPAKFFKLEIFRNDSSPPNRISIETFQLYGNEINFQVDGSGIGVGTSLLKEKLTVEGSASISQCNIIGRFINDVKTNILTFPPNSISGSNVNLVNEKYGTGFYTTNQSSSNTGGDGFYAFDNSFSTSWVSASNQYNSSGVYTGAISSILSGSSKTGEWLQISLPCKTRLNSYRITPRSSDSQITAPKGFYIGGSIDGTSWTQIDSQVKTWTSTESSSNFIVSSSSNLLFYNYYRIVVNAIGTGGAATTSAVIVDWKLFGETYTYPNANVGKSLTYGDSYTTDHVNIATNALYDDVLTLSLNANDLNSSIISGGNVNIWGKLSQNDTSLQPIFYKTGGLKDLPFVRFSSSNTSSSNGTYLIGGEGKLQINDNNGLTIVTMIKFTGDIFPNENIITYGSNLSSSNDVISFSRYGSGQQLVFTLYNSDSSASNSIQTGSSIFNQNEWNIFAARYTNSTNKLEIFKNNIEIAYTYGSTTLSNNMYNFSTVGGAANIDIGALYVWNSSVSDSNLTQITDIMMQGYPQLFTDGSARLTKSVEGTLSVKSFNTYTNSVFRYPPIDLISNASSILNQTYGNGLYKVTNSSYYQSNDIYNGYNAFQTSSTTGWYGQANSYNVTTGNYTGSAVTMVGNIGSQIAYFGDWLQLDMPDSYLTLYYTILPRADYGTTAPVSWYFLGSTNGIDWNIIDTQTNYSFTSQTEITFDISTNTTPYKYYRISIIKCKPTGGVVGIFRVSLYAKSRNTIMCQDDKVIVFDKLGIGLSNPASSLHVAGFSVLSGLKIIAGNASNVIVPLNPGGTGSGGGSGGGGSGSNPVGYNTDSLGTIFGISGTTSAYSFRYVVGSSSNEVARLNGLGYFGLGTNNPTELLALSGGNVKLGSNLYVLNRLSIGKSNPQAGLDLATNAIFGSNITVADIGNYTQGTGLSNATKFAIITDPNRTGGLSWSNWAAQITHNGVNTSFSMASGRGVKIDTGSEFSVTQSPYSTDYLNCGALEVKNTEAGTLLYVRNDGKIGIGFSNATENLAIVGNMSLSNNGKVIFSTTNSKLGLNVAVPQYELDILGNINFTGNLYNNGIAFPVSRWQNNSQITYYMSNVGIGLSNAVEMLAVYSNMSLSNYGKIVISTSNNCLGFNVDIPTESLSIGCNLSLSNYGKVILATSNNFIGINNSNPTSILTIGGPTITFSNFGNTLLTASNNNLGINMINPTATLTIGGPTLDMSNFGNTILTASNNNLGINNSTPEETLSIGGASISLSNYGKSIITASNSNIGINISDPTSTLTIGGPSLAFSNFGNTTLFASNNYLGVNCLDPQESLCVGGNISLCNYGDSSILYSSNGFLGINMPLPTETLSVGGTFSLSNFGKVVISTSNNFVGIGADPKASLSVVDTFSMSNFGLTMLYASNTNLGVNVQNPSQSLTVGGSIGLVNTGTTVLNPYLTNLGINVTNPSENLAIGNSFSMSNEGTKVILIASNSSLGINNSKPTETLSIGGNFSLSNYGKSVLTASNDFIGINIPIPTSTLSIGGETITMSNYGNTTFTASNNNLGINMIDPEETLSIAGPTFSMSNFGKTILYSSNGYLGIGQPIPTFTLDILGDVNVSGALYSGGTSLIQWINADSNIYYGNGTVGIGTATPSTLLHVSGDVTTRNIFPEASGTYDIGASNNTFRDLYLTGATIHLGDTKISKLNESNIAFQDSNYVLKTLVVNQIQLGQSNDPTDSNVYLIQKSSGGIIFTNITNGINNPTSTTLVSNLYQNGLNFGLSVQNPGEALAILNSFSMSNYGKITMYTSNNFLGFDNSNPVATIDVAGTAKISGNVGIGTIPGSQKLTVAGDFTLCNYGALIMSTSNNYLGINTTNPTQILTVGGNIGLSNYGISFIATSNNYLGIGTSNPNQTLSVAGTIGFSNYGISGYIGSSNNYIGIGTSVPTQMLTVAGNIGLSNYGNGFIATSNNFIGIGTSNPTESLEIIINTKVGCNLYVMSNIGIRTSNPSYPMDITGDLNFTGTLRQGGLPYVGGQWSNNSTNVFLLGSNVGISTSTPSEALDINGANMKVGCNLYVMSNVGIGISNNLTRTLTVGGTIGFSNYGISGYIGSSNSFIGIGTEVPIQMLTVAGNIGLSSFGNTFIATSNNYLGVGTSNPTESLDIMSNLKVGCNLYVMSNIGIGLSNPAYAMDVTGDINFTGTFRQNGTPYIGSQWSNNSTTVFLLGSNVGISTSTPSEALDIVGSNMKVGCNLYVMSNIGIGLSNPSQKLMIAGNIGFSNYGNSGYIGSSNNFIGIGTSIPTQKFTVAGNIGLSNYGNSFIATSNNYFGIGTSNPTESLEVITNAKIGCNLYVMSNVGVGKSNPLYPMDITGDLNFTGTLRQGGVPYIGSQWSNNSTTVFLLGSNVGISTSTPSEALDIKGSNMKVGCNLYVMSNVGIGTSNPTQKLDVNGYINVFDSSKSFYGGIGSELNGSIINFGVNDAQRFGSNNSSNNSGFIRVDSRANNPTIQFYTGGSNQLAAANMAMGITSNGYIGIGIGNPSGPLHINNNSGGVYNLVVSGSNSTGINSFISFSNYGANGNNNASIGLKNFSGDNALQFFNSSTIAGTNIAYNFYNSNASVSMLNILANGNIGINTATPNRLLTLTGPGAGTSLNGPNLVAYTTSDIYPLMTLFNYVHDTMGVLFDSYFDGSWRSCGYTGYAIYKQTNSLNFNIMPSNSPGTVVGPTTAMTLNSNGYLGIGTTTPTYKLEVNGLNTTIRAVNGADAIITSESTSSGYGYFQSKAGAFTTSLYTTNVNGSFYITTASGAPIIFNPNNGAGAVGINTATPAYTLEVNGNIGRSNNDLNFVTATDGTGFGFVSHVAGVPRYHLVMKNLANYPADDNIISLGVLGGRWTAVYSANGTIQTSDELDKNYVPLPYGLSDLMKVSTIKYKWKSQDDLPEDDPKKNYEYFGICARELNELFPELVYNEQEPYQINYSEIIPVCINAIKDLKKEKDDLLNIVNTLLTRIENLESKIL